MKKLNYIFSTASLMGVILITASLGSCKKKEKFSGNEIANATQGFELITPFVPSVTNPNFRLNSSLRCEFSTEFNQRVSYKLKIKGIKSGAEKVFSGVGSKIENASWDGSSSNVYFFGGNASDSVVAYLEISGWDSVYTAEIDLQNPKNYHSNQTQDVIIRGIKHIVIDDFDASGGPEYSSVSTADPSSDQLDSKTSFGLDSAIRVEGGTSYRFSGQDDNDNGWSGGINSANLVDFYMVSSEDALLIDSGIDPSKLYFNIFIYGAGQPNTSVQLKVYEQDYLYQIDQNDPNDIADNDTFNLKTRKAIMDYYGTDPEAPLHVYDQAANDGYIYNIEVTWTGWKRVSVPYSDFVPNNDPLTGGGGDRVKESWRICGMAVSLLSFPATGAFTKTYVDFLTVTQGGVFQR